MVLKLRSSNSSCAAGFGRQKKLQGSQTWTKSTQTLVQFGRRKKLQGSQTDVERIKSFESRRNYRVLKLHMVLEDVITSLTSKNQHLDFNVLRLWRRVNYRNPKPDWRRNWFGKRKITGHSNPTLCLSILKQGLEEGKITGFSNQT